MTDETRSHSGVRIDDRGWGLYLDIPLACPENRERYSGTLCRVRTWPWSCARASYLVAFDSDDSRCAINFSRHVTLDSDRAMVSADSHGADSICRTSCCQVFNTVRSSPVTFLRSDGLTSLSVLNRTRFLGTRSWLG